MEDIRQSHEIQNALAFLRLKVHNAILKVSIVRDELSRKCIVMTSFVEDQS